MDKINHLYSKMFKNLSINYLDTIYMNELSGYITCVVGGTDLNL